MFSGTYLGLFLQPTFPFTNTNISTYFNQIIFKCSKNPFVHYREFDFLEAEHDTVSESTESCFNWLSTMRPRSISKVDVDAEEQYQDDERTEVVADQRPCSAGSFYHDSL